VAPGSAAGTASSLAAPSSPQTNSSVSAGVRVALEYSFKRSRLDAASVASFFPHPRAQAPARLSGQMVDQRTRRVSETAARQDIGSALAMPVRRACPGGRARRNMALTSVRTASGAVVRTSFPDIAASMFSDNQAFRTATPRSVAYQMRTVAHRSRAQSCNTRRWHQRRNLFSPVSVTLRIIAASMQKPITMNVHM
jgi:hypothetical protein